MISETEAALLRAVAANSTDDTPRLVYADWLDENGGPARAEFIRLQIETYRMPTDDPEREYLKKREFQLRRRYRDRWEEPFRKVGFDTVRYERGLVSVLRLFDDLPGRPKGWEAPTFPMHEFAGVNLLRLGLEPVGDAEFDRLISSPYLAGVRRLDLPPVSDLAARALLALPHLSNLGTLRFDPRTRLSGETWQNLARSTAQARLRELMIADESGTDRAAAERFFGLLRESRSEATRTAAPTPLPLLTQVNWTRLPKDLLPFSERIARDSGRTGRA